MHLFLNSLLKVLSILFISAFPDKRAISEQRRLTDYVHQGPVRALQVDRVADHAAVPTGVVPVHVGHDEHAAVAPGDRSDRSAGPFVLPLIEDG